MHKFGALMHHFGCEKIGAMGKCHEKKRISKNGDLGKNYLQQNLSIIY